MSSLRIELVLALTVALCGFQLAESPPVLGQNVTTDDQAPMVSFRVSIDRGQDVGQCFGSLLEATSDDGSVTVGAGFPNAYNTRLRADRHALEFFVRNNGQARHYTVAQLPRPNDLCGTYLHARDQQLYSTFGEQKRWDDASGSWQPTSEIGGTGESMRVGDGVLEFGNSTIRYQGRTILEPPAVGDYQLFYYAHGYLCFYHVNRQERAYRPYTHDEDGFSRLVACPWQTDQPRVDLSQAITFNLPVVGETTFAWGQLGNQIVTGSNIGGFYVLADGQWRMLLPPDIKTSFQLYSSLSYYDQLLLGQYPTGRLFAYDGQQLRERESWPPVPPGSSPSAREAQTTTIYGGDVIVGVWPWGEVWRLDPHQQSWSLIQRMFDHPTPDPSIVHPYDKENQGNAVPNLWGQRITSLIPRGADLLVSTSAKAPVVWDPQANPFLAPDRWRSYGAVYRLSSPGHLSAATMWTAGPTTFQLSITATSMRIEQDGMLLAAQPLSGDAPSQWCRQRFSQVRYGQGIYGPAKSITHAALQTSP